MPFKVLLRYVLCGIFLSSCSVLPASGPQNGTIDAGALDRVGYVDKQAVDGYLLVELSRSILDYLPTGAGSSLYGSFGGKKLAAPEIRVAVGDTLQVTIFEAVSGGLFIPRESGSRPGNFVTLPAQTVERGGTISVPYAGNVPVVGRTLVTIQSDIIKRLESRAIEPQVVVSFVERSSDVSVVGTVNAANRFRVNVGGDRVLDMIARAGGPQYPGHETYVTLQRGATKATVSFNTLAARPDENVYVYPNDVIIVSREQRFFTAFGAAWSQGRFAFDADELSLSDAIGRSGGLLDGRADPEQVFLYRTEERTSLLRLPVGLEKFPPTQSRIPVVYKLNLRSPDGIFMAQKFLMRPGDAIYISNASQVELSKFLLLVNDVSSTVAGVSGDTVATRNAFRSLDRGR